MPIDIQWYPGHMARTKRELQENLRVVDLLLEVRDARIPASSHNTDLAELLASKPVITVLAKSDLADRELTTAWVRVLEKQDLRPVAVDLKSGRGVGRLESMVRAIHRSVGQRLQERGRQTRGLRGLVVGVPNVGKSTLINRLAKRAVTKTGAQPGVTRGKQWVRVGNWLQLMDVPGVLWPKFEDPNIGLYLAITGAISDDVFDFVRVSTCLAQFLLTSRPEALVHRYGLAQSLESGEVVLEAIGKRRGYLLSGGRVDEEKAALLLLQEFRQGLLGRFTLETPD